MKKAKRLFFRALYASGAFALLWEFIVRPVCGAFGGVEAPSVGGGLAHLLPALLGVGL